MRVDIESCLAQLSTIVGSTLAEMHQAYSKTLDLEQVNAERAKLPLT